MSNTAILQSPRPWAFSRSELTAGLRRHTGDPSLRILELEEENLPDVRPALGRLRGMRVNCRGITGEYTFELVLKESRQTGTTRAGTTSPGQRETSFYRDLAEQVPVRLPRVFAIDPLANWLVMERLTPGKSPENWGKPDYLLAATQLAVIHDRFWNLGRDLGVYTWLERPLDADFEVNIKVASNAIQKLAEEPGSRLFAFSPELKTLLPKMVRHADVIARALKRAPDTLLHGDYWPGNIHVDGQGRLTVYDWQQVGIGPAVLDLVAYLQTSSWWFDPLPVDPLALIFEYRRNLSEKTGTIWANQEWQAFLDHARMWIFLVNWVDILASTPLPILETQMPLLEKLWIKPLFESANQYLPAD
jgi:hypothetical protein